jgi:hypothetical protein
MQNYHRLPVWKKAHEMALAIASTTEVEYHIEFAADARIIARAVAVVDSCTLTFRV